ANVTDVAVLVVAADDGVMPQTEEAISHARAADVPIVVALNKIDLYGVNIDRIMQQLAANELLPADWGGATEVVKCSALTGQGVDELLDTLLTIAELHEYKANPSRHAYGTSLESEVGEERGVAAKLLVQNGTLKVGDVLVCGSAYGRVKAMYDTLDPRRMHEEAGPSTPVNVTGLNEAPGAGEHFYVLDDITSARELAEQRTTQSRRIALSGQTAHVTLETLHERLGGEEVQTLNIILRADTQGSIEAILKEFGKLQHPEVQLKILQKMVGGITEADVHLADASDAIIIGFNVVPDEGARSLADHYGVQIRRYDIIYQVTDDIKKALEGMLKPGKRDVELGRSLVQRTFLISRLGTIAGCRVLSGTIERNCRVRVIRESRILGDYPLDSLKREKDDAREVREGLECGMKLRGFNDLKEGDILECYRVEEVARTL
ncbi:MAG: translation initiation factor IF-2, partial [Pirellulales bacterium]